jgi:hypothetical protein
MKVFPNIIAGLFTTLVVTVTLALANESSPGSSDERPDADRSAVDSVAPRLSRLLRPFRHERTERDVLSVNAAESLEESGDMTLGENPALSRRLDLGNGRSAHVWPNKEGVCFGFGGSGGCTSVADLVRDRVVVVTRVGLATPRDETLDRQVFVLAVDSIETVTMVFPDGRTMSRPVTDNGVLENVSELPDAVRWSASDGAVGSVKVSTGS